MRIGGLGRNALAEFIGTAFLLIAVVGSGIAAQRLSPNDVGLELFENSTATGVALAAIILALGPVSGAHLNPAVTLVNRLLGGMTSADMFVYWLAQIAGGAAGTILANLMFSLPAIEISSRARWGAGLWLAEIVATFGLLLVIFTVARSKQTALVAFAVGGYIAGGLLVYGLDELCQSCSDACANADQLLRGHRTRLRSALSGSPNDWCPDCRVDGQVALSASA